MPFALWARLKRFVDMRLGLNRDEFGEEDTELG